MSINFIDKTFASLKHKNFRLFFMGQTVSLIGTWLQYTALSWLIYDMTNSKLLLGLIAALGALPILFLSLVGGIVADKFPRRTTLIITQTSTMILTFVLTLLIAFNVIEIWHIVVIATLNGIIFAIDMPVRQSYMIDMAGKKDLMNAIALNSSIFNLARVIGPAVAGIIMVRFGSTWCFFLNGLSFLAVIWALLKQKIIVAKMNIQKESIREYTATGFKYVKENKEILDMMILLVIVGVFGWSYAILFPAIAKDIFHINEKGFAILVSANGIGALLGALFVAYLGNSSLKRNFVNWGIYFSGAMVLLLAFCKIYWLGLILICLAGFGLVVFSSSITTIIQSNVKDSVRGRVMGIWSLVFGGMIPLGNLFAGTFSHYFGISATLIISSIVCIFFTFAQSLLRGSAREQLPAEIRGN
ncbi:MAG: MFS transporter [Candidatus Gastranaerophilales bacterium]|nr:MFS transporter [Candidatus Gastranaerophilales bacterium]